MSRRKITVEGTTYEWSFSHGTLYVFPPKGTRFPNGTIKARLPFWDYGDAVTPRDAANVVYKEILKREPPKSVRPAFRTLPKAKVEACSTSSRLPSVHLLAIETTYRDGTSSTTLLESHESATMAKVCAGRLNDLVSRWTAYGRKNALHAEATRTDIMTGLQRAHVEKIEGACRDDRVNRVVVTTLTLVNRAPVEDAIVA